MRKYAYLISAAALLALVIVAPQLKLAMQPAGGQQHEAPPEAERTAIKTEMPGVRLNYCSDKGLGVVVLCDFAWRNMTSPNGIVFFINDQPDVRMKIVKVDIGIHVIQQLNRERLEALGQYADGFRVEEAEIAGRNALKVKAFAREDPKTRILDYFFVRNDTLYSLMFSVDPKDRWNGYKFLFEFIVEKFEFI